MFGSFPATTAVANDSQPKEATAAPAEGEVETTTESAAVENAEVNTETEATASDDSSEENSETDTETESPKRARKGFERRIEKFNQKLAQREQELDYWRNLALQGQGKTQTETQVVTADKPKFSDFNDIEAYTDALTDWKLSHTLSKVQAETQYRDVAKTYEQRLQEFRKTATDFDDVMADFVAEYGDEQVPEIVQVAFESEIGPQMAYYLAQNLDEVDRIKRLPSHRRLLELGKLEAKLAQPAEKPSEPVKPKNISRAAPPVNPVKGTGRIETTDLADPNLSYSEWVKRREAQLKKR